MAITRDELQAAERRMDDLMQTSPRAVTAHYNRSRKQVIVKMNTGLEIAFPASSVEGLDAAKPGDLSQIEISPTGLGLYFTRLDVDLYLPAVLEGSFGSARWMAGLMGRRGGASKSDAKGAAARNNGRLGGRPRKISGAGRGRKIAEA